MSSGGNVPDHMAVSGQTIRDLSVPQQRALVLRDELRWTDQQGVDKLIKGINHPEPPHYQRINGVMQPPLTMVTLKEKATRFPLGNVQFDGNANLAKGVYIAYLTLENRTIEIRIEAPSPHVDGDYDPVPIHSFVAHNMVGLFDAKYRAVCARMNQINEMRQVAFKMASQKPVEMEFPQGETFSKLDMQQGAHNGPSSRSKKAKKRKPGDPVVKHATNTREQHGLESIPQEAKTATFNAISTNIKVDFFNNVIRTAFPNFDNLMIASWNVVSIYSNVGTEFPDLHKSIVELKSVLQDFEESFGLPVTRKDPKFRRDFAPEDDGNGHDHGDEEDDRRARQPTPDVTQDELKDSSLPPSGPSPSPPKPQDQDMVDQEQDDNDSLFNDAEPEDTEMPLPPQAQDDSAQMPPPRLTPRQQASHTTPAQPVRANSAIRSSPKAPVPTLEHNSSRVSSPNNIPTGSPNPRKRPRNSSTSSQERATIAHSPKLHRKRDAQISSPQTPSSSLAVQPPSSSSPFPPTPDTFIPSTNPSDFFNSEDDDTIPASAPNPNPDITISPSPTRQTLSSLSKDAQRDVYNSRREELVAAYGSLDGIPMHYRRQMKDFAEMIKGKEETKSKHARKSEKEKEKERKSAGKGEKDRKNGKKGRVDVEVEQEEEGEVTGKEKDMPKYLGHSVLGGGKKAGGMGMAPVAPMMVARREGGGNGGAGRKVGE